MLAHDLHVLQTTLTWLDNFSGGEGDGIVSRGYLLYSSSIKTLWFEKENRVLILD